MKIAELIDTGAVGSHSVPRQAVAHQRSAGSGRLAIGLTAGRSRIARLYQQGCAKIRVPRTHSGNALEAVMINTSGGMTGGDRLDWEFRVGANAHMTATTQACERIYASPGGTAQTRVTLHVEDGASLNWLPQETILFDQGRFSREIAIDLAATARALIVESTIFGRRSMGETVRSGAFHDRWRVRRGGRMIHAEDFRLEGAVAAKLARNAVTGSHGALATILCIAPQAEALVRPCREFLGPNGGASFWNGKLLARFTARDGYALRQTLVPLIGLLDEGARLPRVWSG